jgi:hypothetical protein
MRSTPSRTDYQWDGAIGILIGATGERRKKPLEVDRRRGECNVSGMKPI